MLFKPIIFYVFTNSRRLERSKSRARRTALSKVEKLPLGRGGGGYRQNHSPRPDSTRNARKRSYGVFGRSGRRFVRENRKQRDSNNCRFGRHGPSIEFFRSGTELFYDPAVDTCIIIMVVVGKREIYRKNDRPRISGRRYAPARGLYAFDTPLRTFPDDFHNVLEYVYV